MAGGYAFALSAVLLANVLRDISTELPHQLSDETAFLLTAKYFLQWDLIRSLGYLPVPGLVFLKIGSYIARAEHYYLVAKIWNALCLTLAAVPAYYIARRVMSAAEARVASVLVAITPPTIYGAYFTPEAEYILVFWTFAWISLIALIDPRRYGAAVGAGALAAVAYLLKPHAVALVAAYVAAVIALTVIARLPSTRQSHADVGWRALDTALFNGACFGLGLAAAGLVLGKLLGASWLAALDVRLYSELVTRSASTATDWSHAPSIAKLVFFHLTAIVAALAMSLAAVVGLSLGHRWKLREGLWPDPPLKVLGVFSLALVTMLLVMTAKATVDFHTIYGGSNTLDRLHGRYYSFALPLLVFMAAACFRKAPGAAPSSLALVAAAVVAVAIPLCMVLTQRQTFTFLDAPDLTYLLYPHDLRAIAAAGTLCAIALGLSIIGPRWLILASWGAMSLLNVHAATRFQQGEDREQTGDRAVTAIRGLFTTEELGGGVIVAGAYPVAAARAAFRLASTSPVVATVREAHARANRSTKWILVLGDRSGRAFESPALRAGDSVVYLIDRSRVEGWGDRGVQASIYSFSAGAASQATVRPAHAPETWGTWLSGTEAEVVFPSALPERGTMIFTTSVLDPQRQSPVTIQICGRSFTLRTTGELMEHQVTYACPSPPERIRFIGMKPLSPRDIGLSGDPRALALALEAIEVSPERR